MCEGFSAQNMGKVLHKKGGKPDNNSCSAQDILNLTDKQNTDAINRRAVTFFNYFQILYWEGLLHSFYGTVPKGWFL